MPHELDQQAIRATFEAQGDGPWTTVHDSTYEHGLNLGIYCAIASPERREEALNGAGWLLSKTDGAPGFVQHWEDGEQTATYLSKGSPDEDIEPLILVREWHGAADTEFEIDQQFRLFHNLRYHAGSNTYVKMNDDGSQTSAVRFDGNKIEIRTALLKQYLAARGLDLLLFVDSVMYSDTAPASDVTQEFATDKVGGLLNFFENRWGSSGQYGSRYLATKVIRHGPVTSCGIWPYEAEDDNYPEFIIGEDEHGKPVHFSCNPSLLADYFGKNPEAPHYLTPVHFRRAVLQKYYDNPELYSVEDGYLRCASLWGVVIDNDHTDRVLMFLGDIGRDLPAGERDHWRANMIPPDAQMSETNIRRSFLAQATSPKVVDLVFRRAYRDTTKAWEGRYGWRLFRDLKESDVHLLQQLRLPLNDGQNEFEDSIKVLAKLMSDALNEGAIGKALGTKIPDEKGISKFERFLTAEGYPHVARDIAYLRKVQELRSKVTAHLKGGDYQAMLARNLGTDRGIDAIQVLLRDGLQFLADLREWVLPSDTAAERPVAEDETDSPK